MEVFIERSTTKRQTGTCEEAGLYCDSRFGGFDAREGEEIVCKHHCDWDVHASTQWKATSHMSISPE